jgi:hypothetical protein
MQELAIPSEPSDKPIAKGKKPRITALVREACELIATGQVKTITGAAEVLNCSREHLSKQLNRSHVQDYLAREAKRKISASVYRAAHVKIDLLDATSEKVRSEVASEIMAIGGIAAPKNPGLTINNNVAVAGYVINLATKAEQQPAIDITPERAASGGVSETAG